MSTQFQPLLEVFGRGERLTARPGRVVLDKPGGIESVELDWSAQAHDEALELVTAGPLEVAPGIVAAAILGTLVLVRSVDPNLRIDDLATAGALSPLCARVLDSALSLGRNVLVAGAWPEASVLMAALVSGGRRPACLDDPLVPAPTSWVRFVFPSDLATLNPDRVCLWRTPPQEVAHIALNASSLVAWVGAARLDRALMRYEVALERAEPRGNPQMQVLAGVDLVATVTRGAEGLRVREVAEIAMIEDGYRPRLLFSAGASAMQQTLIPVESPSFTHELRLAGMGALADELESVAGTPRTRPQGSPEPRPQRPPDDLPSPNAFAPSAAPIEPLTDASPPGWELDQLADEDLPMGDHQEGTADDAALAATYGLAPPPRPKGVPAESFDDILKRMRDGEIEGGGEQ